MTRPPLDSGSPTCHQSQTIESRGRLAEISSYSIYIGRTYTGTAPLAASSVSCAVSPFACGEWPLSPAPDATVTGLPRLGYPAMHVCTADLLLMNLIHFRRLLNLVARDPPIMPVVALSCVWPNVTDRVVSRRSCSPSSPEPSPRPTTRQSDGHVHRRHTVFWPRSKCHPFHPGGSTLVASTC